MAPRAQATIESQLGKPLDFLRSIWALDHALHARSKAMAKRNGLTGPQRLALRIISTFPNISSGELARVLHVHPSTLTGVLQRLEGHGLVARTRDSTDGRRALFAATKAGEKAATPVEFSIEGAVKKLLKRVSAHEAEVAQQLIIDLADELLEGTVSGGQRDE
ncbi:MAG: MarR family transcriptional regulator [Archangium gephyra]|uniref:MarR family transcriptional regulator n=1 Tax=Archangium gephyra TaxID=48 RepID=A0A2W5UVM7_9BACT|nr:MAG: MarR family transcriptional regulator [Archangium gephyra]